MDSNSSGMAGDKLNQNAVRFFFVFDGGERSESSQRVTKEGRRDRTEALGTTMHVNFLAASPFAESQMPLGRWGRWGVRSWHSEHLKLRKSGESGNLAGLQSL